ncbi:hypothetical protein [Shinella sp. JR1-6]|uniref:hypothetical protein n=1 Tax=Shinella sp. JR1-6 TaxID=2527671 RepID=UPI00102D55EA|nr:hypothetical protein [Shinella sp. JR1-6]TAA51010.1 hypothetical protein EXZ48_32185 [Shinella sp. JR1-6]
MAIKSGFTAEDLARMGPDELTRRKLLAEALLAKSAGQREIKHPFQGFAQLADTLVSGLRLRKLDEADKIGRDGADKAWGTIQHLLRGEPSAGSTSSAIPEGGASAELAATTPGGGTVDMTGNEVYDQFMNTVKEGGVNNPYALAAIAATGKAESGFDPNKVNATWSDPSESGQAGTSGGIMSWRGPRYAALAASGDMSPSGQARYFLQEDPQLIERLNAAQSVEEAQSLMNNAWRFAGYNRPGGEAANRLAYANSFLPNFQGQQEVASLDPNAGLSQEVAEFQQPPEYAGQFPGMDAQQFDQRFGGSPQNVPQNQQQLAQALIAGQQQGGGQQAIEGQMADPRQQQVAQALIGGQQQQGIDPALMEVLGNQYLDPQRRAIAQMLLEQQMQQRDPLRQMQLQKAQMELERMRNPQPEPTDDIREYKFAVDQGYNGTFQQFMMDMKKAGATNINNMGNIPPGYELVEDPKTGSRRMQPIAGSPAALEMDEKVLQKERRQASKETGGNVVVQDIDRIFNAMDTANLPTTGGVGNFLSGVPGTAAFDIGKLVDTIKANATFDKLQAMREASPTGGALGAVSDSENKLLGAAIGSLEQSQSDEQFRDNLARVQNLYLDIIHGPGNGPERRPLRFENKLPAGKGGVPEGMDPEVWDYMTPEEKRLFQ